METRRFLRLWIAAGIAGVVVMQSVPAGADLPAGASDKIKFHQDSVLFNPAIPLQADHKLVDSHFSLRIPQSADACHITSDNDAKVNEGDIICNGTTTGVAHYVLKPGQVFGQGTMTGAMSLRGSGSEGSFAFGFSVTFGGAVGGVASGTFTSAASKSNVEEDQGEPVEPSQFSGTVTITQVHAGANGVDKAKVAFTDIVVQEPANTK